MTQQPRLQWRISSFGSSERIILSALLACAMFTTACAPQTPPPTVSHDGLQIRPSSKVKQLYVKPGIDPSIYDELMIRECVVSFRKHWQRDRTGPGERISTQDMERIKAALSDRFKQIFIEVLQGEGGYRVVSDPGPNVLLLRPAIIDLDVTAPDTMQPGRTRTYTSTAGEMTLYLELFDSSSNEILARVVDRRKARDSSFMTISNTVTNTAEANRILKKWARLLRDRLDEIHGGSSE